MLGLSELNDIIFELQDKMAQEITYANRCGEDELKEVLKKYGYYDKKEESSNYIDLHSAKILMVGKLLIKQKDVEKLCKSMGIDPNRIDYVSFDESTNYNYESLQYSNKYSDVIFGSVPHSGRGMEDSSSIIVHLETHSDEYPNVIRAMDSNGLALNKTSIKNALMQTQIYLNII